MRTPKILLFTLLPLSLASCNTEAELEVTKRNSPNDSMATTEIRRIDSGVKQVEYIPPIGTGQSSAGNVKRERKFYIR
jgi:hypothetical protein